MPDEYEGVLARNYDALYGVMRDPSGDAAFYRALAEETGGPVLELGCGTGRVLLPIAALGIPCVGVDASPAMLAALRAKNPPPNLELVEARMETFDLGARRFRAGDVAVPRLPAPAGRAVAARGAGQHPQAPGARRRVRVRHLRSRSWRGSWRPGENERLDATFTIDGVETRRFAKVRTDLATQIMEVTFRFEPAQTDGNTTVRLRWFYRYEMEHLLARAGFTDVTIYGGYDRRPWRPEGETVIVARAP